MNPSYGPPWRWLGRLAAGALAVLAGVSPVLADGVVAAASGSPVKAAPVVSSIELRGDFPPSVVGVLRPLVVIDAGRPLDDEEMRRTLRNLQASGLVAEAAVYSRPDPDRSGAVVAIVALWPEVIARTVRIEGELGLDASRLRSRVSQWEGEPLSEDQLVRGVYRLQQLYRDNGYFAADVRLHVDEVAGTHQADVVYGVDSGPRTRIGSVDFRGDLGPFDPRQLAEALAVGPGKAYDARALEEDSGRLRRWMVGQDHREARVEGPAETRREDEVDLAYQVEAGPRVEVEILGAERKKLEERGLLPFLDEDGYDQALLVRSRDRLRRYYQQKGYYQVQVETQEERRDGVLHAVVGVEKGPELVLRSLDFTGNESFADDRLAELIATRPRSRLVPGSGHLVDEVLEADLDNLRSFYALQGYWQAEVGPPQVTTDLEARSLGLVIPIHEGPRRRVGSLVIDGGGGLPEDALSEGLPLEEGGPFHPRRVEDAVEQLRLAYQGAGFEWVQISPELQWDDETLVEITLHVVEGPRMLLDRLVVRGNQKTRPGVLRRAANLEVGEPVSRQRLLEVERDLARLGIFSRVDVRLSAGEIGGNDRDVVIQVREGRSRRVSYGLGYDSDDGVRGLLGVSHRNLFGRALTLQADARLSERDQRYRLLLQQPFAFAWDIPVTYSLFRFDENRESFDQLSRGVRIEAFRVQGARRLGLVTDFRRIRLENVEGSLDRIERQDREIEITSVIPSLLVDHRDDLFDPTEGWSTSVLLQYAFPAFSTDAHFFKLFLQQTQQIPLGRAGVLAASLRLGAIEPVGAKLADVPLAEGGTDNPVPIGERFFAGGRTTHRAFGRDLLGITGETRIADLVGERIDLLPAGGNGLLLANLEYRFPLVGALGGTVFADAGNVWRDWRDVDLSQVRYGLGLGLRYGSPIGPIRLEVGFNLDPQPGESSSEFHLTFGNPF
ncbi:MAG: outer membrane protein assembly factor BamA [Acidobacteria bacterium]|nr:outer membrane protein assembly factor BamA [Acidobacteriota bacterium]